MEEFAIERPPALTDVIFFAVAEGTTPKSQQFVKDASANFVGVVLSNARLALKV